jgi:hypothetical protein
MSDDNTVPAVAETVPALAVPETVPAVEEQKHDVDYADEEATGAVS